jgi:ATP synthase protein I
MNMQEDKKLPSLEELDKRIKLVKARQNKDSEKGGSGLNPTRVSLELFSGVVVGTGFGLFLDKWLETSPIFMITLFFFGVAAGALNIYKLTANYNEEEIDV